MKHMMKRLESLKQMQLSELKRIKDKQISNELENKIEKDIKYFDWNYEQNKRKHYKFKKEIIECFPTAEKKKSLRLITKKGSFKRTLF